MIKMNNTYSDIQEMKTIVEEFITEADENYENYDINEILDEIVDYDYENGYSFNELFYNKIEFWDIAEKYELDKDYSDMTNNELLDNLEDAINEEDEFTVEQLRKEILNRMNGN